MLYKLIKHSWQPCQLPPAGRLPNNPKKKKSKICAINVINSNVLLAAPLFEEQAVRKYMPPVSVLKLPTILLCLILISSTYKKKPIRKRVADYKILTTIEKMNSILITGCNRGLGLGLVKAFNCLPEPPQHLFTTCRNLEQATELKELAKNHSNIHILEIDLKNFDDYDKLVGEISAVTKDAGLNVLFNNAGIATKSVRLGATKHQDLLDTLQTNTVAPIMLTKACLPLLKKAADANGSKTMGVQRAAIINMSSILGSIQSNAEGGMYGYRTSKAALNAATKSMSIDLLAQKILCVSLHPGWVRTDMGGGNAPLDVPTSTTQIVDTICKFNESHNGGFYQYDGAQLPW